MASKAVRAVKHPIYKSREWGRPRPTRPLARPWYGLDTERDAKTGRFVCGWRYGEDGAAPHDGLLDGPPGTYWLYNLSYDVEGFLRDVGTPEAWAAKVDGAPFPLTINGMDGTAVYMHRKIFRFKSDHGTWRFLDAAPFNGMKPLFSIGAKDDIDASQMSLERYTHDLAYQADVDRYCIQDARIVYDWISGVSDAADALGVSLGSTPGSTARGFLATLGTELPRVLWRTQRPFLRSYSGGRFELTKRGILHDVRQYDIVSAYPWALTQCPWIVKGDARRVRRLGDHAVYGTYLVSVDLPSYLGVVPVMKDSTRIYSTHEEKVWMARPELDWAIAHGADVTIHRGLEITDAEYNDTWAETVHGLFALKEKGGPTRTPAKIILNSLYGILVQLIERGGTWRMLDEVLAPLDVAGVLGLEPGDGSFDAGQCYAPVYAGHLTSLVRTRILDAALETSYEHYAGGHTDSVLTTGRLSTSKGLGAWELQEEAAEAHVLKTGTYAIGETLKMRGITKRLTDDAATLWEPTRKRKTRTGIKLASSWDDVSIIHDVTVENAIALDQKRAWEEPLTKRHLERGIHVDSAALSHVAA